MGCEEHDKRKFIFILALSLLLDFIIPLNFHKLIFNFISIDDDEESKDQSIQQSATENATDFVEVIGDKKYIKYPLFEYLKEVLGTKKDPYTETKTIYDSIGPFLIDADQLGEVRTLTVMPDAGYKWHYIGMVNPETNQPEGFGKWFYKLGALYEGWWKDGKLNGLGRQIGDYGEHYVGEWLNHSHHGKGRDVKANGDYYEGDIFNGLPHGFGTKYILRLKKTQKGTWKNGAFFK